jgi:hypothetical protein
MTDSEIDLALEALLAARSEVAPAIDEQLLRQCYAIQRKHQFTADRAQPAAALERVIDTRVEALVHETNE